MQFFYENIFYICFSFTILAAVVLMVSIDKNVSTKEFVFKGSFIFRNLEKYVREDRVRVVRVTTNMAVIVWFLSLALILFQGVATRGHP